MLPTAVYGVSGSLWIRNLGVMGDFPGGALGTFWGAMLQY